MDLSNSASTSALERIEDAEILVVVLLFVAEPPLVADEEMALRFIGVVLLPVLVVV